MVNLRLWLELGLFNLSLSFFDRLLGMISIPESLRPLLEDELDTFLLEDELELELEPEDRGFLLPSVTKWSRFRFFPSFFSIRRLSSSLRLLLMSFNNDELLDELFEELLDDPDEDSSGNLSPRGMISMPAGFLRLSVAASADEIGVIDTIGLMSAFLDFETDELENNILN